MVAGVASQISGADFSLTGTINTGAASLGIFVREAGRTIGLGDTAGSMTISGAELQQITATGLTIGNTVNGSITVDNISAANSNNISGTTQLIATRDNAQVVFSTAASTFNALTTSADDGIDINVNVTTDVGNLAMNGNFDSAADTLDAIDIAAGITLTSAVDMTLNAATNGVVLSGEMEQTLY